MRRFLNIKHSKKYTSSQYMRRFINTNFSTQYNSKLLCHIKQSITSMGWLFLSASSSRALVKDEVANCVQMSYSGKQWSTHKYSIHDAKPSLSHRWVHQSWGQNTDTEHDTSTSTEVADKIEDDISTSIERADKIEHDISTSAEIAAKI